MKRLPKNSRARGASHSVISLLVIAALAVTTVFGAPRFATAIDTLEDALAAHTVEGVTPSGISIDLFDYWITRQGEPDNAVTTVAELGQGINSNHTLKFGKYLDGLQAENQDDVKPWNVWTQSEKPYSDIVNSVLGADGYPQLNQSTVSSDESLAYLFDPGHEQQEGRKAYRNVKNLLRVNDSGYFEYNSANSFAEFVADGADSGAFTLYDKGAVIGQGGAGDENGQFFPFNKGSQVFELEENGGALEPKGVKSEDKILNHYFGLTMTTNFVQQYGGHTTEGGDEPVTYEFTGDDDVWVFIDDVLVGDLGGNHNAASLKIDFSTGEITINGINDGTIRDKFVAAGKAGEATWGTVVSSDTFADDTYHTLKFFYLERGNVSSNMWLKFNLKTLPETDIVKVDQVGQPIEGATFNVFNWTSNSDRERICTAKTEGDGTVVLRDPDNNNAPLTLEAVYKECANQEGECTIRLIEEGMPNGYRATADYISLRIKKQKVGNEDKYILLSNDPWTTGAYAMSKVLVTAPDNLTLGEVDSGNLNSVECSSETFRDGMLFVVIEKKAADGAWDLVSGDPLNGWDTWSIDDTVDSETKLQRIKNAGEQTDAVFAIGSGGAYEAEVAALPGDVLDYAYFADENGGTYRGAYFFTTASSWNDVTADNLYAVENTENFAREFSARVYVPNIINRVIVQKLDEAGNPVNGAEMGIWGEDQVDAPENGPATLKEGAELEKTETTHTLTKYDGDGNIADSISLEGACIFSGLEPGVYWVGEVEAPDGYVKNNALAKVIVSADGADGVYADAMEEGDGITVQRGVGRIVRSMVQFATDDDIDTTLHNIKVTPVEATHTPKDGTLHGSVTLDSPKADASWEHLEFEDEGNAVLDYVMNDTDGSYVYTMDKGIPALVVRQCRDHKLEGSSANFTELGETDITSLFTGVTIVQIANVHTGDYELTKTVKGGDTADESASFTFDLRFAQFQPAADSSPTAQEQYAATVPVTGTYGYTVTDESGNALECGTLTLGKLDDELAVTAAVPENEQAQGDDQPSSYWTASEGGPYTVKLSHGQTLAIKGLPVYTTVTAIERDADGFTTTHTVLDSVMEEGAIPAISMSNRADATINKIQEATTLEPEQPAVYGAQVEFINTKVIEPVPDPGQDPDNDPDDNPGDEPSEEPGDDPDEEPGDDPDDGPGDKPGDDPGDDPDDEPGDDPDDEPGDKPGNDPDKDLPGTGDVAPIAAVVAAAGTACIGGSIALRKRRDE